MIGRLGFASILFGLPLNACGSASPGDENAANARQAAAAAPQTSGDARVDALLAALASRDEARARALVGEVGYLVATGGIAETEDQFIERALGCRTDSIRVTRTPAKYRIVWRCPPAAAGGAPVYYNAAIAADPPLVRPGGGLVVLEFSAGRVNPMLAAPHFAPQPTPRRSGR